VAVAAVVGRAAGGLAFDEEQLGFVAIARGAVHELAGQAGRAEDALAILEGLLGLWAASRASAAKITLFMISWLLSGFPPGTWPGTHARRW